jgi:hypothetical protein
VPGNQEIIRSTRTRKGIRNPPGNHPISEEIWVLLDFWCSGEANEKEKYKKFSFLVFFSGIPGKISFWSS